MHYFDLETSVIMFTLVITVSVSSLKEIDFLNVNTHANIDAVSSTYFT